MRNDSYGEFFIRRYLGSVFKSLRYRYVMEQSESVSPREHFSMVISKS